MTKDVKKVKSTSSRGLTPKQEKFCQLYIELGIASDAYRQSYDTKKMKAETINTKAKEMLKKGPIRVRVEELKKEHSLRHNINVDNLVNKLERVYNESMDRENPQFSAAINAVMGQAKILGLDKQVIDHTSSDGSLKPSIIELVAPGIENDEGSITDSN